MIIVVCIALAMLSGASVGIAYASGFTITTRPLATVIVNSTNLAQRLNSMAGEPMPPWVIETLRKRILESVLRTRAAATRDAGK